MSVILGYGGYVQLSREWPEPTVFPKSSRSGANAIFCQNKAFWTGQRALIYSYTGLPLKVGETQYAPSPVGHRFWGGSTLDAGPTSLHRGDGTGAFWNTVDQFPEFWETTASTGFQQVLEAYVNRDQLDRITFYETEGSAINKNPEELIVFSSIEYRNLLIAPYSSSVDYGIAFEALGQFLYEEDPDKELGASAFIDLPKEMQNIAQDPEQRGWSILVGCREWTLQTDPTVLDTTAIGEDFGDSVKDVVRGSGSFNGFIETSNPNTSAFDARGFIRLMLMTETGSKARVRLRLQDQRSVACEAEDAVWIECDILLGPGELSTSVDDAVRYSSQFVVVKDKDGVGIKPLIGPFA
jgi:hypothetical protein